MNLRTLSLLITVALIALLAAFNWNTLAAPSVVSLGVTDVQAPLGVLMLALTCLLGVFFVAYVLWLQGSVLMEARRHAKEMQAQRDLADKAEASRFTELRTVLEDLHARDKEVLMARLDALEAHLVQRAQESDNSTAAYGAAGAAGTPAPAARHGRCGLQVRGRARIHRRTMKNRATCVARFLRALRRGPEGKAEPTSATSPRRPASWHRLR